MREKLIKLVKMIYAASNNVIYNSINVNIRLP